MAAKKHSKRIASDKTTKGHQTTDAAGEAVPADTSPSAELAPPEGAEAASAPTAETQTADTPEPTRSNQPTPGKKLSALDATAKVLGESGQAMTCAELIEAMAAQGYWSSPTGRTPAGTLYSAVLRDLKIKGDKARFLKTARGKFALRQNV
jgi:hypothetical protein